MPGRFSFTAGGVSASPGVGWSIQRELASAAYASDDARGARLPKQLNFEGRAVEYASRARADRIAAFKAFFTLLNSAMAAGERVRIDDLFLGRHCFGQLTRISGSEGALIQPVTLEFQVPDGVWHTPADSYVGVNIRSDQQMPHITFDNPGAGRGANILFMGTTTSNLVNPTVTWHSHNLLYDSGFSEYQQLSGAFTASVGEWKGNDALARLSGLPGAAAREGTVQVRQTVRSLAQRVHCVPGRTYRFTARIKRLPGGAAGTCVARIRYFNLAGNQTGAFNSAATAAGDWADVVVSGAAPASSVYAQAEISMQVGGTGFLVNRPQLSEGAAAREYINTSDPLFAPKELTIQTTIAASADPGGAFHLDTGAYRAYQRGARTPAATASVSNGAVTGVQITDGGAGYTVPPGVNIGGNAAGTAKINAGAVWVVELTNAGSGYDSAPPVSFNGGTQDALRWFEAGGRVSGEWPSLLPGQNHLRFKPPGTSGAQMPVAVSVDDERII